MNEVSQIAAGTIEAGPISERSDVAVVAAPQAPAQSMLNFIAMALERPDIDANKLEVLMRLQREHLADEAKVQFNRALHDAQAEIPPVEKLGFVDLSKEGSKGDKKGYAFARWEDMDKVLRPIMDKHGFTLSFDMVMKEGGGGVVTGTLLHVAGHSQTASIPLALDAGPGRNNLQAMGSTLSYGKRYVAEMLFNIIRKGQDDDGREGGKTYLSRAQEDELLELARETKTNEGQFLQVIGLEARSFSEVEAEQFMQCKNALMIKKRRLDAAAKP